MMLPRDFFAGNVEDSLDFHPVQKMTHACMYFDVCVCVCVSLYVCVCASLHVCLCVCVCVCVCV